MKYRITFLIILISHIGFSQDAIGRVDNIQIGETRSINAVAIEFVRVISDSRCPKNVMCVRAGEAKVVVALYKDGKFIEEKTLIFYASGVTNEAQNQLVHTNNLNVKALALLPYPTQPNAILKEDYFLKIQIN